MTSYDLVVSERVASTFRSVFDLDDSVALDELEYNSTRVWDSVAHMTLIAALEQQFDCMLEMDEILEMSSYPKAVEIMGKHA